MKSADQRAAEFKNLREKVQNRLRNLDLAAMANLTMSLSVQEFRSLEFLASEEPRKSKELADFLGLAMNSVTAVVDGLEKKRLVRRRRDDNDRRVVRLELTKAGRNAGEAIAQGHLEIYRTILGALTVKEQTTLLSLLEKIANVEQPVDAAS